DERDAARLLLATEEAFASKVSVWERWLGELHLMVEPVEPEPEIWLRIKTKLPPPPETVIALPRLEPEPEPEPEPQPHPQPQPQHDTGPTAEPAGAPDAVIEPSFKRFPDFATMPAAPKSDAAESDVTDISKSDKGGSEWLDFERQIAELKLGVKAASPAPESVSTKEHLEPAAAEETPSPSPSRGSDRPQSENLDGAAAIKTPASADPAASQTVPNQVAHQPAAPQAAVPAAPVHTPAPALANDQKLRRVRRRLSRWRAIAGVLLLAILAAAALPALWKLAPERVPPKLRPIALMRSIGIPVDTMAGTPREPAPPESQFDE
ncbi:MAG: hypothetical protein ACREMY_18745, partial [bacterium]